MNRRWPFLSAVTTLAGLAACSPEPCKTCASVAGTYTEAAPPARVDCGDLHTLLFSGVGDRVVLTQSGSKIDIQGTLPFSGVLHADLSASFGPVPAEADPVDENGNPDPTRPPTPGKAYLEGWFVSTNGDGQVNSFHGTYVFIADDDGCEIDSRAQWSR